MKLIKNNENKAKPLSTQKSVFKKWLHRLIIIVPILMFIIFLMGFEIDNFKYPHYLIFFILFFIWIIIILINIIFFIINKVKR